MNLTIWYPAVKPADYTGTAAKDAAPDMSQAPYPVLLGSTTNANGFATHIVSHGFVVTSIDGQDSYEKLGSKLIDYPQEILAALEYVSRNMPEELVGVMDTDNAGVFGYSFDGYNALALSGARFDPQYHSEKCQDVTVNLEEIIPPPVGWWKNYMCPQNLDFSAIVGDAAQRLAAPEDGLWQPMTDPRIKVAAPMAPEGALLFGKRGLQAVRIPILIMDGTADTMCPYTVESVPIYENIGSQQKTLISFVDQGHMMVFDNRQKVKMLHFLVAFFNVHLKGNQEDAYYFSEDYVNQQPGLHWGAYSK